MSQDSQSKTIHTGGAQGADTLFCSIGLHLGMEVIVHSFHGHKMSQLSRGGSRIIKHSGHDLEKAREPMKKVREALGRAATKKESVNKLILRSYFQVADAELVVAVSTVEDFRKCHLAGGTGYAVKLAHIKGLPILVLDQERKAWFFSVNSSELKPLGRRPKAHKFPNVFAGIGSRRLSPGIEREVLKVFEKSKEGVA